MTPPALPDIIPPASTRTSVKPLSRSVSAARTERRSVFQTGTTSRLLWAASSPIRAAGVCRILTYTLKARWLAELIRGTHRLPPPGEMLRTIEELKSWKRERMPFSRARAARLLIQMQHDHDELLEDFGADPLRKTGVFAPLKEVFAPYEPKDYRSIASGGS